MDITSLTGITSDYIEKVAEQNRLVNTSDDSFQSVLDSADECIVRNRAIYRMMQKRPR